MRRNCQTSLCGHYRPSTVMTQFSGKRTIAVAAPVVARLPSLQRALRHYGMNASAVLGAPLTLLTYENQGLQDHGFQGGR
jgi:hypothetical protein